MKPKKELLFCALGGSGEIGMNVNLYGCDGKWVMVDLGMTFADPHYPGIDLVFADLEFIEDRRDDLLGIVLTHAHEDHIGAVPYFAADLGVPIYATPFTARLVREKLVEAGVEKQVDLRVVPNDGSLSLGSFDFRYIPLAHSIAEGNALLIDTPYGRIFHTGDWKLDDAPQIGQPATPAELTAIGDEGVLALVCDSTNVFNPRPSGSEGAVREALLETVAGCKGRRVVVTTFASNVARLQTLGEVAQATGRRLVLDGDIIAPADGEAMVARRKLGQAGLVTAALAVNREGKVVSPVEIATIGIPLEEDLDEFVAEAQGDAAEAVAALKGDRRRNRSAIAEAVRLGVRRCAERWIGRKPVVQVLLRES